MLEVPLTVGLSGKEDAGRDVIGRSWVKLFKVCCNLVELGGWDGIGSALT